VIDRKSGTESRARTALKALGARIELLAERGLEFHPDTDELVVAHVSASGREHFLAPAAATAWAELRAAALADDVTVLVISGFRSFDRQFELVKAKVDAGDDVNAVLSVLAPPGCSEHHTGRAVDVGTPGGDPLSDSFESTDAFRWLTTNAADFGFRMSYPRGNRWGYQYEPWHWCYVPR